MFLVTDGVEPNNFAKLGLAPVLLPLGSYSAQNHGQREIKGIQCAN
jgi:hypothetical protein